MGSTLIQTTVVLPAVDHVLLADLQLSVLLVQLLDLLPILKEFVCLDVETDLLLETNNAIQEAHLHQDVLNAEFKVDGLAVDSLQSVKQIPQPRPQHLPQLGQ